MSLFISTLTSWSRRSISESLVKQLDFPGKLRLFWNGCLACQLLGRAIQKLVQIQNSIAVSSSHSILMSRSKVLFQEFRYGQFVKNHIILFLGITIIVALAANSGLNYYYNYSIPFKGLKLMLGLICFVGLIWIIKTNSQAVLLAFKGRNSIVIAMTILLGIAFGCLSFELRGILGLAVLFLVLLTLIIWQRPILGVFFFILFLPLHHMTMTFLSQQLYLSDMAMLLFKSWKDWILLVVVTKSLIQIVFENKTIKLGWIDFLMVLFLSINMFQVFQHVDQENQVGIFHSLRLNLYFIVCFYCGRILTITKAEIVSLLVALVGVGTVAALFCIPEKIWILSDLWVSLGYVDYLKQSFDQVFSTPNGLPFTFWLEGYIVRRTGSFFMGPIDLAYALLLIIPATIMLFSHVRQNKSKLKYFIILFVFLQLMAIGLVLSRAAIAGICLELAAVSWFFRKKMSPYIWRFLGITYIVLFAVFVAHDLSGWISRTATFQESSAAGHMTEWKAGIKSLQISDKGYGLGTAGLMGARFDESVTGENQYLIIGVELGLFGLLVFLLLKVSVFLKLLTLSRKSKDEVHNLLIFITLATFLGIVLVGLTSQVYLNNFLIFITWWLIGIVFQKEIDR